MLRYCFILLPIAFALCFARCTGSSATERIEQAKQVYILRLDAFKKAADSLLYCLEKRGASQWQHPFMQARLAYKRIEVFADYYFPSTAKAINGPPVKEVEADDPVKEFDPSGFQVMEEHLFPEVDTTAREELLQQARILQSLAQRLQNGLESLELSDGHVFDALRLHLLRIIGIGLSGGDNGIAQNSVAEAAVSLISFQEIIACYAPGEAFGQVITNAIRNLQQNPSFVQFDRAAFLSQFAAPLWHQLHQLQKEKGIPFLKEMGLVNTISPLLFDSTFFNAASFSQTSAGTSNPHVVEIGHKLFTDKRLSGNGLRSCATCHQPQYGYADHLAKNTSVDGKETIFRNTPTILYAALQPVQFADSRLTFLEDQAKAVIENHSEMKGDLRKIAQAISNDTVYKRLAVQAFQKPLLTEDEITKSLAAFIRHKSPFSSPFDRYLNGDKNALDAEAIRGFNLFMGKAKCGTCHFMPLFNGVVPPHFSKMESEIIGVPKENTGPYVVDADEGKYRVTGAPLHRFAFKTPTVRNSALTAPYMHNGIYKTLEEVIDFYDKGGGAGLGLSLPNQTLPAESLNLTPEEKHALVQFLKSLTDR